jgi:hypothetical protein
MREEHNLVPATTQCDSDLDERVQIATCAPGHQEYLGHRRVSFYHAGYFGARLPVSTIMLDPASRLGRALHAIPQAFLQQSPLPYRKLCLAGRELGPAR